MLRRKYKNSVEAYGGTSYDYTTVPAVGVRALVEHQTKIIDPLNAVISSGYSAATSSSLITSLAEASTKLSTLEGIGATASNSGCTTSACTGLCQGGCETNCHGCSGCGECDGGCYGCGSACETGCQGSCGDCGHGCTGCTNTCRGCYGCGTKCDAVCSTQSY